MSILKTKKVSESCKSKFKKLVGDFKPKIKKKMYK